jgi:hypothetical protein
MRVDLTNLESNSAIERLAQSIGGSAPAVPPTTNTVAPLHADGAHRMSDATDGTSADGAAVCVPATGGIFATISTFPISLRFGRRAPEPEPAWWDGLMKEPVTACSPDSLLIDSTTQRLRQRVKRRRAIGNGLVWFSVALIAAMAIAPLAIGRLVQQLAH